MTLNRLSLGASFALVAVSIVVSTPLAAPRYSTWSEPVNLGPTVNSAFNDTAPSLSKDGVALYFSSNRPCGVGDAVLDLNIWVTHRATDDAPWGAPECLEINVDGFEDSAAAFSRDGHWMFFVSDRPGSLPGIGPPNPAFNARDIWISRRSHVQDDHDWSPPVHGGSLNSNQADAGPTYFEGDGTGWPQLFFTSNRNGTFDIWQADVFGDGQFGVVSRVNELSTDTSIEARPSIRHDGLELFFFRDNPVGGLFDIFVSIRPDAATPWSLPENLGAPVSMASNDQQASISPDRTTLHFASNRLGTLGGLDLWVSRRDKDPRP